MPAALSTPVASAAATLRAKEAALVAVLAGHGEAVVAFSAGVDSSYLLAVAHAVLGERVLAVTADSPSLTRASLAEAEAFCRARGIRHAVVETDEFEREEYLANDGRRCYHCKAALLRAMHGLAAATRSARGGAALLIGAIADDLGDHRPGMRAAAEAGAQWPLATLGFTKAEVRAAARARGLAAWNRPAEPCLSSRVPYGERVTVAGLRMIEAAELVLKGHGFIECRARHHQAGERLLCRIEVPAVRLAELTALRAPITAALGALGYAEVTIDPGGLVSGGFNALLPPGSVETAAARGG